MTIRCTYSKQFFGTNEAVEAAIRKFDQVLRRMYNVYGGKRVFSGKTADGEYTVTMTYTANWITAEHLPEFWVESIDRRFNAEANRLPEPYDMDHWYTALKRADNSTMEGR